MVEDQQAPAVDEDLYDMINRMTTKDSDTEDDDMDVGSNWKRCGHGTQRTD
ncbi:AAEL013607-PA [Aedes aegypti]|uniref:AAEL013607-PA n=1 Tax=Aedes aegypti TaxID=7159 RepID=Q16IM8_AEDAE|nr:AAEL013607-PA [Aedes aegypti]